ncbi:J domain-containing protein [bacterium]|jgi:hypothetical protein|nr:J domain-containing protein [bacterium]
MARQSTYERYCELLEVAPGASSEQIQKSFRELIKVWHPDRFSDQPELQRRATIKTSELTKAFQWLRRHGQVNTGAEESSRRTPETILNLLRNTVRVYLDRHPETPAELVERAVRGLLWEVTPRPTVERVYPFQFLLEKNRFQKIWQRIVDRRRQIVFWGLAAVIFLFIGGSR